jgi:hypothetical protein
MTETRIVAVNARIGGPKIRSTALADHADRRSESGGVTAGERAPVASSVVAPLSISATIRVGWCQRVQ